MSEEIKKEPSFKSTKLMWREIEEFYRGNPIVDALNKDSKLVITLGSRSYPGAFLALIDTMKGESTFIRAQAMAAKKAFEESIDKPFRYIYGDEKWAPAEPQMKIDFPAVMERRADGLKFEAWESNVQINLTSQPEDRFPMTRKQIEFLSNKVAGSVLFEIEKKIFGV